ncbi:MAG: PIN domain-containing protein, partial [Bacteroidota bacterium]
MIAIPLPRIVEWDEKEIVRFLNDCFPLEMDKRVRELAIEIRKRYKLKLADAVIAGTAYVHNYQLLTADSDFDKVDGLYIVKYEL